MQSGSGDLDIGEDILGRNALRLISNFTENDTITVDGRVYV